MAKVVDLSQFIAEVRTLVDKWTPPGVNWYPTTWFRGHGNADWKLEPGWYRLGSRGEGLGEKWYSEQELMMQFKLLAPRYVHNVQILPSTDWEWLFLMQHYGLPTRLLDWTKSALIGLYFALRDNKGKSDAAVWMLNPWWLNKQSLSKFEIPAANDPRVADWGPLNTGSELKVSLPVAIEPVHASPRISNQRGVFTIHGTQRRVLEKLSAVDEAQLVKFTIAAEHVSGMLRDLRIAGVSETTVFQELDGLSRDIKSGFFGL